MIIRALINETRAVIDATYDTVTYIRRRRAEQTDKFYGAWTNEGDCTAPSPSHFLDVRLSSSGGGIGGIISSRSEGFLLPNASFAGKLKYRRLIGSVVDVSRGKLISHATVEMRLVKGNLHFSASNVLAGCLPTKTILWRFPAGS